MHAAKSTLLVSAPPRPPYNFIKRAIIRDQGLTSAGSDQLGSVMSATRIMTCPTVTGHFMQNGVEGRGCKGRGTQKFELSYDAWFRAKEQLAHVGTSGKIQIR